MSISLSDNYLEIPTIVVGVDVDFKPTKDGMGSKEYNSLADALKDFPELDPNGHSAGFFFFPEITRDYKLIRFRFETEQAFKFYST